VQPDAAPFRFWLGTHETKILAGAEHQQLTLGSMLREAS
jgi:hypothetical protein